MRVKDIWSDLRELTGTNDEDTNYAALALGLSWLANEKLFDPFIGYIDFTVDGGYTIALPREVKTPLQINLNNNPSFHRSRLWEFAANSDGTVEGETIGWTWDNRGYARVQDERALPSKLRYVVDNPEDVGKTLTLKFLDDEGRFHYEVLTAANTPEDATESIATVHQIESVIREATLGDSYLIDGDAGTVGRYYNDEEQPEYRVIKLSKTGVAVRMMFRRHEPQTFSSQEDVIPFHSRLAIIWAAKTVRLLQGEIFDRAAMAASLAKEFAAKEQGSRDEAEEIAAATQVCGVRNSNISTLDSMIVADVYDDASEIFGPIGRAKLLDWISMARDLLAKKGQWDATVGNVDLWKPDTSEQITPHPGMKGTGIFTLPRYCGSVLNVRPNSLISYPRNGWFEFHMNGTGEGYRSAPGTWDMLGTACIISDLQRDEDTRKVIPVKLASVCFESADVGKTVRVYGLERLADGSEVEVWRSGAEGYLLTMALTPSIPATDAPNWVDIRRIKKDETSGFSKLITVTQSTDRILETLGSATAIADATHFTLTRISGTTIPFVGMTIEIGGYSRVVKTVTVVSALVYTIELLTALESSIESELDCSAYTTTDLTIQQPTGVPPVIPDVIGVDWVSGETKDVYLHFYANQEFDGQGTFSILNSEKEVISQSNFEITSGADELIITPNPAIDDLPFVSLTLEGSDLDRLFTLGQVYVLRVRLAAVTTILPATPATVTTLTQAATYNQVTLLGYHYPDELEPIYRRIKVYSSAAIRVTVRYRARAARFTSLHDPMHLKNPLAIIEAMRSLSKRKMGDHPGADACENTAVRLLREQETSDHPTDALRIQFDGESMPGGFANTV
jgi:hypothetical protein